jgi:hypothetical protein
MITPLTPEDAIHSLVYQVDKNLEDGMCFTCAIRLASKRHDIRRDRVEDAYLAQKQHEAQEG